MIKMHCSHNGEKINSLADGLGTLAHDMEKNSYISC